MARGRIPAPKAVNQLKGDTHKRRRHEAEPEAPAGRPTRPGHLSGYAAEVFDETCDILAGMGLLHRTDGGILERYAENRAMHRDAYENLQKFGRLLVISKKPVLNPLWKVYRDSDAALARMEVELGLTPAARSRMRMEKPAAETNPVFERFFKPRGN